MNRVRACMWGVRWVCTVPPCRFIAYTGCRRQRRATTQSPAAFLPSCILRCFPCLVCWSAVWSSGCVPFCRCTTGLQCSSAHRIQRVDRTPCGRLSVLCACLRRAPHGRRVFCYIHPGSAPHIRGTVPSPGLCIYIRDSRRTYGYCAAPPGHCAAPSGYCAAHPGYYAAPPGYCVASPGSCAVHPGHCATHSGHCAAPPGYCVASPGSCAAPPGACAAPPGTVQHIRALRCTPGTLTAHSDSVRTSRLCAAHLRCCATHPGHSAAQP